MKKAVSDIQITSNLHRLAPEMNGVFLTSDLCHLIGARTPAVTTRAIKRLVDMKELVRWQRGVYTSNEFDMWVLAMRLEPKGYVSMTSVLSKNGLVGTRTRQRVEIITVGINKKKILQNELGRVEVYSISPDLFFGYENKNGIAVADNEKAFLDLLYYYNLGNKFIVDPLTEVNLERLNIKTFSSYLKNYKNPKFKKFVQRMINANT